MKGCTWALDCCAPHRRVARLRSALADLPDGCEKPLGDLMLGILAGLVTDDLWDFAVAVGAAVLRHTPPPEPAPSVRAAWEAAQ